VALKPSYYARSPDAHQTVLDCTTPRLPRAALERSRCLPWEIAHSHLTKRANYPAAHAIPPGAPPRHVAPRAQILEARVTTPARQALLVERALNPSEGAISLGIVRAILGELRRRQVDLDDVLRPTGLRESDLCLQQKPFLALGPALDFISAALYRCNDPALGPMLGAQAAYAPASVLAPLIASCSTLREAISHLLRYEALLASAAHFQFAEEHERAQLSLRLLPVHPPTPAVVFLREYILAAMLSIGRQFASTRTLAGVRVSFRHRAPGHANRIVALLGCEVEFHAESDAISFPARGLDRLQSHADRAMRAAYCELAEAQLRLCSESRPTADRLRRFLQYQRSFRDVDAQFLARILGISARSLRRKLEQDGTTVRQLLDEARQHAALHALDDDRCVIKEVSERLGFSDSTAFHRAFRRWTGHTPAQHKRKSAEARAASSATSTARHDAAPPW